MGPDPLTFVPCCGCHLHSGGYLLSGPILAEAGLNHWRLHQALGSSSDIGTTDLPKLVLSCTCTSCTCWRARGPRKRWEHKNRYDTHSYCPLAALPAEPVAPFLIITYTSQHLYPTCQAQQSNLRRTPGTLQSTSSPQCAVGSWRLPADRRTVKGERAAAHQGRRLRGACVVRCARPPAQDSSAGFAYRVPLLHPQVLSPYCILQRPTSMSTSLGAGLFGFPPAPGFTAPDQAPPEAWLLLFLDEHGDDELYSGLFGSCKAGRAWALRTAPEACLELNTIKVQHPDAWRARLGRGCDALSVRGPLPTRLEVTCNSSTGSLAACCLVPSAFYGHGGAITALQINDWWPCAAATALLPLAAAALQQLTRLSLHPCPPSIPPPASLPHLRELDVYIDAQGTPQEACDACLRSCAAYLPHLSTFAITYCTNNYDDMRPWRLLFNPASRTTTLTSLALPDTAVPDELFDLLLRYTPALIRLHVACLWLREDRSGDEWAVQALVAPSLVKHYAYLPRSSKGVTRVYEDEDLEFEIDCREVSVLSCALGMQTVRSEHAVWRT